MNALLAALRVYSSPYEKVRAGRNHDGGYVICALPHYDCFVSGGLGEDASFEEHVLRLYPDLVCHAYDGTIERPPSHHPRLVFHRKNIGALESDKETNVHALLERHQNVLVKMDIESSEYAWLDSLSDGHLRSIKQMVVEFHVPFTEERIAVLSRLGEACFLVHLHPNNYYGTREIDGVQVPELFEATYLRRSEFRGAPAVPSSDPIPGALDQANVPANPDIFLAGYPYTATPPATSAQARQ